MPSCSMRTLPFSAPLDVMLTMLVCATRWLSMHLYTLAYMSMHESCLLVCRPCFNTMKLLTFDLNLHLSLVDTILCLFSCLFAFKLVFLLPYSLLTISIMVICFMPLSYVLCIFSFIACLLVSCLCLGMYTHGARMLRARA